MKTFTWRDEWEHFKLNYKKSYASPNEEAKRFKVFKKNMVLIAGHNHKKSLGFHGFTLGVNEFADMVRGVCLLGLYSIQCIALLWILISLIKVLREKRA